MSDDEDFNDVRPILGVHPETDLQEGNTAINSTEQFPPAGPPGWTEEGLLIDPVTGLPVMLP